MASEALPAQYMKAGREYLDALVKLGLHPEFLGWGQQHHTRQWMLVLVTSTVEIGGPLAMNELLFKAYNMNATPKEISPFIVRVFGSKTLIAPELKSLNQMRPGMLTVQKIDEHTGKPTGKVTPIESYGRDFGDIHIESRDVYVVAPRRQSHEKRTQEWLRFKDNVERLAA
jgi:hypothetical protein